MMLIDFHTHAFPEAIARRAIRKLADAAGALRYSTDGTVSGLTHMLERADAAGVLLPVATNPRKLGSINDWAAAQASERVIPFGAAHPYAEDFEAQLDHVVELGLRGVKLHPEYQSFRLDEPRAVELYRAIGARGLITVFHMGHDLAYASPCLCTPRMLANVLDAFAGAPVVAAHMGGFMRWTEVETCLCGRDVYLDTAFCHGRIIRPVAERIVRAHGADRVLFGSDCPWSDILSERDMVSSWDISDADKTRIFSENAKTLLGLS